MARSEWTLAEEENTEQKITFVEYVENRMAQGC